MAKKQHDEISLLTALKFISVAQKHNGDDDEKFCMIAQHEVRAFNKLIAAGMRIEDNLMCCPQTSKLVAALEECQTGFSLSLEDWTLVVRSGAFTANVPIIDGARLQWAAPDPLLVKADDRLKAALMAVASISIEKSDRVHEAATLMQSGSCMSTNGTLILEAWHGIELPPNILLPKAAIKAIGKTHKPLLGVGYGPTTVTFHFEDRSWIRTQRYLADWPKSNLLSTETQPRPLSRSIFAAANQLCVFSEDGQLYCMDNQASSHPFKKANAFNARLRTGIEGINGSRVYPISNLIAVSSFATSYDDVILRNRTFVYGVQPIKIGVSKKQSIDVRMRGVFSHATEDQAELPPPAPGSMEHWQSQVTDEDVPF